MKWFKLDCNILQDAKIMRLINKHAAEGFATYVATLCLIAKDIDVAHQDCILEYSPDIISTLTGQSPDNVRIHLDFMSEIGLISKDSEKNVYFNTKILSRIDDYHSKAFRKKESGQCTDKVPVKRREEKRKEENMYSQDNVRIKSGHNDITKVFSKKYDIPKAEFKIEDRFPEYPTFVYHMIKILQAHIEARGGLLTINDMADEIQYANELYNKTEKSSIILKGIIDELKKDFGWKSYKTALDLI